LAQSLTGNIRTLECMNERSGRRDRTAEASADSGSVVPSFTAAVFVRHAAFDVGVDDVMALRIESSGDEWDFVPCAVPQSGNSNTSNNSFSCFLTAENPQQQVGDILRNRHKRSAHGCFQCFTSLTLYCTVRPSGKIKILCRFFRSLYSNKVNPTAAWSSEVTSNNATCYTTSWLSVPKNSGQSQILRACPEKIRGHSGCWIVPNSKPYPEFVPISREDVSSVKQLI